MLSMVSFEEKTYYSFDSICKTSANLDGLEILYSDEFLNTLEFNCFPQHELNLKINAPIMLLRNLNSSISLCNGTRLIITDLRSRVITVIIITGSFAYNKVYISKIILSITNRKWPFILRRR
ncbi:hypothetical protein MANES_10G077272v8 [Manihot esculenta]|uniref:Uncharacterized protein n=1 Tax=Manihot esculenta TaxID=3983 RepID=A0ACB7GZF4_MANES|nr:hypothetical protein MANES_10G077272v8 [Manihot esculenta]